VAPPWATEKVRELLRFADLGPDVVDPIADLLQSERERCASIAEKKRGGPSWLVRRKIAEEIREGDS